MFCVPGESYLALLDALYESDIIQTVICRHEGGAAMMAVADAKLTGRPGLMACSRGPGATNASVGVHLAQQDAVPLVVLVGQVARFERGRGAFQEVDYGQFFGGMAKMVREVSDAAQLPETIARAYHVACSGTPGPVVVVLPEDMLSDATDAAVVDPHKLHRIAPCAADIDHAVRLVADAARPLIIAGGGLDTAAGRTALAGLAQAGGIPVALSFKHQDIFDNSSPYYAGHLGFKIPRVLLDQLEKADLIVAIGTRLGDVPTQGYSFPKAPVPEQKLIHVWPDPGVPGRVFATTLGLACDPVAFSEGLGARLSGAPRAQNGGWAGQTRAAADALSGYVPRDLSDGADFGAVALSLAKQAPKDTIVVTDSGNFSSWVHCVWPWDGTQRAIGAVGGAMGLAVPGTVAACLRHPGRTVIGFVGDGGVMMTGNELATAIALGVRPKIVVADNGTYGTIRLHQEKAYPGKVAGTDLVNPDFAAWAASFGARGLNITKDSDIDATVGDFLAHDGPAVLHVRASAEAISAFTTLTALRDRETA